MQYNYKTTADINQLVGNLADPSNLKGLEKQLTLIDHEIKEGEDNLSLLATDPYVLRDDIADILFTTYGLCHRLAFTADEATVASARNYAVEQSGITNYEAVQLACSLSDPAQVPSAASLLSQIRDTFRDLREAVIIALPRTDVVNLTQKLLTLTYLLGVRCGYPVDEDYAEVCRSNLSKFDNTPEDAALTREKYLALAVVTKVIEGEVQRDGLTFALYVTKSAVDQVGNDGARYPNDKWLKSHRWSEPVYRELTVPAVIEEPTLKTQTAGSFSHSD